ncbi:MAG: ATP-dependent DNA helicase RecG [Hydrogenothermaceae bacterium]
MENLNKIKVIVEKLINSDDVYLSRVKGLSNLLKSNLKDILPEGLYKDIDQIDDLLPAKKRDFLKIINSYINIPLQQKTKEKTFTLKDLAKLQIEKLTVIDKNQLKAFRKIQIKNVYDALYYFPVRYEDRRVKNISTVRDGETGTFFAEVEDIKKINRGRLKTEVTLRQGKTTFSAFFMHDQPYLFVYFRKGKKVKLFGRVSIYKKEISLIHPDMLEPVEDQIDTVVPVYSLRGDSNVKTTSQTINHLRRAMFKLVEKFSNVEDFLPEDIKKRNSFPDLSESLRFIHRPSEDTDIDILNNFLDIHQKRLIFDELFLLVLAQKYRRSLLQKNKSYKIEVESSFLEEFEKSLPFPLTNAQKRSIHEILSDISKDIPMNRMLQGDVGSGKTLVATGAMLAVAKKGYQSALMVPTEILANQHFNNIKKVLSKFIPEEKVALLTGSTKPKEKEDIYKKLQSGEILIVIGTHALIEDRIQFKNLALAIVDEQHRFGVEQRKALIEKTEKMPHILVMTATPIPRTLALANYGDLDISKLDELPKNRKPIKTLLLYEDEREKLYSFVEDELKKGRQIYVVYPLIEESEKTDLKSAEEGFKHWQERFENYEVGLLHGKMKQEEKDLIMQQFKDGKINILVSTTVIEVGVDVPNASVMVVEEAHRFGLSQIHQLRGRVGRGEYEGFCFLMAPTELRIPVKEPDKEKRRQRAVERLKILVKTTNGFEIAEYDLKMREAGDLAGTKQSGKSDFDIADLQRDEEVLKLASNEAENIIFKDPFLEKHPKLREMVYKKYGQRFDLVNIS